MAGRLMQLPYKPNAVRRGANRRKTPSPAWFARGLTAGRLMQLPYKPNAVRRGSNRCKRLRPAWFARSSAIGSAAGGSGSAADTVAASGTSEHHNASKTMYSILLGA